MKCREAKRKMVALIIPTAQKAPDPAMEEHLASCEDCSVKLAEDRRLLTMLSPECKIPISTDFEERVMNQLKSIDKGTISFRKNEKSGWNKWISVVAAAAALVLITMGYLHWSNNPGDRGSLIISQALAAERSLLDEEGIVHVFREITYYPVEDSLLARTRWSFLTNIDAAGEMHFHQLGLPDDPSLTVTFSEDSWYDPSTNRFAVISRLGEDTIFVNSYDGRQVCTTVRGEDDKPTIVREEAAATFSWPQELRQQFGASGEVEKMLEGFEEENIREAGSGTLEDGTPVRLIRAETVGPDGELMATSIIRIRKDNNTIAEIDMMLRGEKIFTLQFDRLLNVEESSVPWDLGNIDSLAQVPGAVIRFDMMKPDVTARQLLDKAGFPTFLFNPPPAWTTERKITVLSMKMPGMGKVEMAIAADRGGDGRHVVLAQSSMYFRMAEGIIKNGELLYTSPAGYEFWSSPQSQWIAKTVLSSARGVLHDIGRSAADCTGYVVITPYRPVLLLAINGKLSGEELQTLADRLILVDEYFGNGYLQSGVTDPAGESGRLALIAAVGQGDTGKVKELIEAGASPNAKNPHNKMFPLWMAAARGKVEVVELLLSHGARVVPGELSGKLPLFRAVHGGYTEIVRMLLRVGAEVDEPNRDGLNSLWFAATWGDSAMVELLLAEGADIEKANKGGMTPLMMAAKRGRTGAVGALLASGANVNARDEGGKTLLMHSMDLAEYVQVTGLLIAAGADVNARMPGGWSVLQHALDKNRAEVVALLRKAGAME